MGSMCEQSRSYRKVETMFEGLQKNITSFELQKGYQKSYPEQDFTEDCVIIMTMKDGIEIEICDWHDGDIFMRDFSVEKTAFNMRYDCSFEEYAVSKGLYAEDIEVDGVKWQFYNQGEKSGCYRLQYYKEPGDFCDNTRF